jgi:hypothetical protein
MRRSEIHRLHTAQIQQQITASVQFLFQLGKQLIGRAEKKVTLQLDDCGLVSLLLEDGCFGTKTLALGPRALQVDLVQNHGPANLITDKQQYCKANSHEGFQNFVFL